MPQAVQYTVDTDAPQRLNKPTRKYLVRYVMEGKLIVEASDAFEATRKAEQYDEHALADLAELEMLEPVEVER